MQVAFPSTLLVGILSGSATAFSLTPIGTYQTGIFEGGAAEISAYDPVSQNLFVTNGSTKQIDILNLNNPQTPTLVSSFSVGGGINSVAYKNGIFAIALTGIFEVRCNRHPSGYSI